jgi:ABC-type glycerol-3-phosphate transport system substrate-binding protein
MNFLQMAIFYNIEEYVNWETGNVYFDTGGFAQLLEFADRFPAEFVFDWENDEWFDESELIATGRQIMSNASFGGFRDIEMYLRNFGGDIVFKGYPTESRNGNSLSLGMTLAITTSCVDKDGAWEFMRTFFTPDWQRENSSWRFPLNQTIFDELIVEAMTEREPPEWDDWAPRPRVDMPTMPGWGPDEPLTQAQVNQVLALIDSVTGVTDWNESLMEIITEGAEDFFNGRGSAQDAARIIQSRASILVAEQS